MAHRVTLDILGDDDEVLIRHEFYGQTLAEAEARAEQHKRGCPELLAAERDGCLEEFDEAISDDDWPGYEEEEAEDEDEDEEADEET